MEKVSVSNEQVPSIVEEITGQLWRESNLTTLLEDMKKGAGIMCSDFIDIINAYYEQLLASTGEKDSKEQDQISYIMTYEWSGQVKAFLLLWRDVLFQLQKARLLYAEKLIHAGTVDQLMEESRQLLIDAAEDLMKKRSKAEQTGNNRQYSTKNRLKEWRLQTNPWPTYRKQLEKIAQQCVDLLIQSEQLTDASAVYSEVREQLNILMAACKKEITGIEVIIERTVSLIRGVEGGDQEQSLGKIAVRLEDVESENPLANHLNTFTFKVEMQIDRLPENIPVAIAVEEGMVEIQEINLKRRTRQWLESEILPLLYEGWEITESLYNGMKMVLVNTRNRALLLSAGNREGKKTDFDSFDLSQPLQAQKGAGKQAMDSLVGLENLVDHRLDTSFKLSYLYASTRPFLDLPIQSTINQLQLNQNKIVVKAQRWLKLQLTAIRRFKRTVEQEETLSVSEKVVRYINGRQGDAANTHYTSIFLTKGFVGESFSVGRKDELAHMGKLIRQWQQGFRGAVAVTGQRFSGKSLFGELVSSRYFSENTIRLMPGEPFQIQGRKMNASYDLHTALEFIRKYTLNKRPMIWLDDLELWWEPALPLSKNVRTLIKFIDDYSNNIFFMVSMGNSLHAHLQKFMTIGNTFQTEMNMDYMTAGEIKEAILIRHGATHMKLVDKENQEITPPQFNKKTKLIHRHSRGNIGEALLRWSGSTRKLDADHVYNEYAAGFNLPDFLNSDSALLLSSVMLQKRTNEYRLRKLFGPAFTDKYSSTLQRLINTGLLARQLDGWLEINELVAGDLGALLERKKHIKYR